MPILSSFAGVAARGLGWSAASGQEPGAMILVTPTSVVGLGAGSSATINTNGSVDFSTVYSISLNGVFTSDYENYVISCRTSCTANAEVFFRMRAAGTDNATTTYLTQYLLADGTSVSGSRITGSDAGRCSYFSSAQRNGFDARIYRPQLAQPTALRSVSASGLNNAYIRDYAMTHSVSTSYDGFTMWVSGATRFTGQIAVYGLKG